MTTLYIGVVGTGETDEVTDRLAEDVGRLLAEQGAVLVCGGLGGVMAAACRGARSAGGVTVGLLPGDRREDANPYVSVAIATGLGEMRNPLIVRAVDALVAIGGGAGTLSEIAFARKTGRPVVGIHSWEPEASRLGGSLQTADSPEDAVAWALASARA